MSESETTQEIKVGSESAPSFSKNPDMHRRTIETFHSDTKCGEVQIQNSETPQTDFLHTILRSTGPFSPNFHRMVGIWLYLNLTFFDRSGDVAMATNFRVKIGEIGLLTFIRRPGIPKPIGISQFRLQNVQLR